MQVVQVVNVESGQNHRSEAVRNLRRIHYSSILSKTWLLTSAFRYCVRPNSGRIEPGGSVEVSGKIG